MQAIVAGGSIGGLAAAIGLRSLGWDVEVHEKSSGPMESRGAGLVVQQDLVDFVARHGGTGDGPVAVGATYRAHLERDGSFSMRTVMPQTFTSWDATYRQL